MKSKELSVDLWDGIVSMHRSVDGYRNIFAALNVPMSTAAFTLCKWKKFGILPWTLTELQRYSVESGDTSIKTTIPVTLH